MKVNSIVGLGLWNNEKYNLKNPLMGSSESIFNLADEPTWSGKISQRKKKTKLAACELDIR